jgi:hypothetical protein
VHRRSHNYSQYLEATNVGLVHRGSHNYSQYLEATNGPHVHWTRTGICSATSTLSPSHAQSEEANSLARRLPSRMRSVETSRLRVKLFNLQGRIYRRNIWKSGGSVK